MKKKNFFMRNKTFTVFGVLAILIILTAVFAPVGHRRGQPCGRRPVDRDPAARPGTTSSEPTSWDATSLHA